MARRDVPVSRGATGDTHHVLLKRNVARLPEQLDMVRHPTVRM